MQILTPGHTYILDSMEGRAPQTIQFIKKEPANPNATIYDGASPLVTIYDGTTNEEVLTMLIDRLNFLQGKHPCRENAIVLTKLEESLMWLNKRTSDRKARGVEGTNAK